MKSEEISPFSMKLDFENPRFSLFKFETEKDIIKYLYEYENIRELINAYIQEGYNSIGERIILLKEEKDYIVLEGNRRIAAIKLIFQHNHLLSSSLRNKVKKLKKEDFLIPSDIVLKRESADYKIASKHVDSIKNWSSINKYVYYYRSFIEHSKYMDINKAISKIAETTPESISEVRRSIKHYKFLSKMHKLVKTEYKNLSVLSMLDNDVLTSRIYNALKKELNLKEESYINLIIPEEKEELYNKILFTIGQSAWISISNERPQLNTRTFQKQNQWKKILHENELIPDLENLINQWHDENIIEKDVGKEKQSSKVQDSNSSQEVDEQTQLKISSKSVDLDKSDLEVDKKNSNKSTNKYKLFIDNNELNKKTFFNDENIDLLTFVRLYDINNERILLSSSKYKNIVFSNGSKSDIILQKSKIIKGAAPGKYDVKVSYDEEEKNFTINVLDSRVKKSEPRNLTLQTWILDKKDELKAYNKYSKIVVTFDTIGEVISRNKSITENDNLVLSFAIRALLEYLSNAYIENVLKKDISEMDLTGKINRTSDSLNNKDLFNKEQKKMIKPTNDVNQLNGTIHSHKDSISNTDLFSIINKYKGFIDSVIHCLQEKG